MTETVWDSPEKLVTSSDYQVTRIVTWMHDIWAVIPGIHCKYKTGHVHKQRRMGKARTVGKKKECNKCGLESFPLSWEAELSTQTLALSQSWQCILRVCMPACQVVSVMCDSLCDPHGLYPTRLLCPRNSPGKTLERVAFTFSRGVFPPRGSNPNLLKSPALAGGFFTTHAICKTHS